MQYRTKTEPAYDEHYPWTIRRIDSRGNGYHKETVRYPSRDIRIDSDSITYALGPKYIRQGSSVHCNWKYCKHVGSRRNNATVDAFYEAQSPWGATWSRTEMAVLGLNPLLGSFYFPAAPAMPDLDLSELSTQVYGDLAGRVDQYFLSLESIAGILTGNSLFKSILGVGRATDRFARSIRDLRRLKRAFGKSASLYSMWSRSKDLVREILGLELGTRFGFKATLNDLASLCRSLGRLDADLKRLELRNDREILRYSKSAVAENSASSTISGTDVREKLRVLQTYSPNAIQQIPASLFLPATAETAARHRATIYCWARVRYGADYISKKRILQSRLGLDKPLSTIWAIIPCSFLIDYLINVQGAAEELDNALNEQAVSISIRDAWLVESQETRYRLTIPSFASYGTDPTSYSNYIFKGCSAESTVINRFERRSFGCASIMASLSPFFSNQDGRWLRRVGTGLEILLSRRRR